MSAAPDEIIELVARFERNIEAYKSRPYNEAQVRREFIDPFFEALGWDVSNKGGLAEAYKDVIHEDAIKVGGATEAPDYCFRIGGTRKFFLEAKRPSVDIKGDEHPAYQLRRYAWSAKLALSILTDFEELAVYDCQIRPVRTDKASAARVMYLTYKDYVERWEEIEGIFSRGAILKGSFDKYAAAAERKKGTTTVDKEFLREISEWRKQLARHIAFRNRSLGVGEVNFAVQRTIDRILFLRMCEDRGIETYGQLLGLRSGREVYARLCEVFEKADAKYNSGLFHFRKEKGRKEPPDELTLSLEVPDEPIQWILHHLYYPQSPYEFSVLPAEILGNVYEQFLGKVIRITPGRQTKIEDKPEVKKAGGVYYTPAYIVDYIVKNTVGRLCEGKTPKQIAKLRIVDPACGSGSFLLGAYTYLLDYHRDWYVENDAGKHTEKVYQGRGGQWYLTIKEKKRILLNNIYGVDIDSQAVEVTKLSLLLKVLEGETQDTVGQTYRMFHERALPDLAENIKCGNSLIGTDFYKTAEAEKLTDEQRRRVNAFDWEREFPEVFKGKTGGFDAVIGNPPWGGDIDRDLPYFHKRYPECTQRKTDSFKLFTGKGIMLARGKGLLSMIVPNAVMRQRRYADVREILVKLRIRSLVDLGENVFERVVAPSCVFVVEKSTPETDATVDFLDASQCVNNDGKRVLLAERNGRVEVIKQAVFRGAPDFSFASLGTVKAEAWRSLGETRELRCRDAGINYQRVGVGMRVKGKSDLGQRLLYEGAREKSSHVMFWKGSDIGCYRISQETQRWCRPECAQKLRANEVVRLATKVYETAPKILLRQTADSILACIDYRGIWFGRSVLCITHEGQKKHRLEYFLSLLNSRYLSYLYRGLAGETGRVFAQVKFAKLKQLPIRTIDFANSDDRLRHDKLVGFVERMLELHRRLGEVKVTSERARIEREIGATDEQIDGLVYELYGLTDEEIAIVEEAVKKQGS